MSLQRKVSSKKKLLIPEKKYNKKMSKLQGLLLKATLASMLLAPTVSLIVNRNTSTAYDNENPIFDVDKVNSDLDFYGGDERYVVEDFNFRAFGYNESYNHFKPEHDGPIKVVVDTSLNENMLKQIQTAYDYINSLFAVINDNYKFEVVYEKATKDYDILIIEDRHIDGMIGAQTKNTHSNPNSRITKSVITYNTKHEISNAYHRQIILHEMLHVLLGNYDVNEEESETFSTFNYGDLGYMEQIISMKNNDSICLYTPLDVSTLISVYGDSSVKENKEKYLDLLNKVYTRNVVLFSDKQPYYEKGFDYPFSKQFDKSEYLK